MECLDCCRIYGAYAVPIYGIIVAVIVVVIVLKMFLKDSNK
jgi:hypothetical protein